MGRVSFELFQSFWPKVAENPTSEEWTDSQRDLAQAGTSVKGIVVSDTLKGDWQDVRIIWSRDAYQQLAELKRQDVIISADEETVTEPRDLQRVVQRHKVGEKIALSFLRGGKKRKVTVVL